MKKKLVSLLLAAAMVVSMAACGKTEVKTSEESKTSENKTSESTNAQPSTPASEEVVEEELTYPLDTDETLTIAMMGYHFKPSGDSKDITDTPFWEAWQEKTGVTLKMDVYETEDAYNLMLASGDLPDILMWCPDLTNGGAAGMIKDEIIATLSWDELNKWAPDYGNKLTENEMQRKLLTMEDGTILGFGNWNEEIEAMSATNGLIIRADWLEDLGMDAPTTPDEFLDMLRAFKNEKGAEYPMALTSHRMNLLFSYGFFSSPYGLVNGSTYVDNGTYHVGYYEPEYKELLGFFNTMYKEGLFNPDYLTLEQSTVDAMLYDGRTGLVQQSVIGGLGAYVPAMKEYNPEAKLGAIPGLLTADGKQAMYGATESPVHSFKGLITTECENKEIAMEFLNYSYTEEGALFMGFGIEGESYDMVDGKPVFKESITKPTDRTMAQALQQYCRSGAFWPYLATLGYFEQSTSLPEQRQANEVWMQNDRNVYMTPPISVLDADVDAYSKIMADVNTYQTEMRAKFISGEESLDNFDAYIQGLKDRGIEDAMAMMQKALDAYNAK